MWNMLDPTLICLAEGGTTAYCETRSLLILIHLALINATSLSHICFYFISELYHNNVHVLLQT